MPSFTAEATLYEFGTHYRTRGHEIDLSRRRISVIYPARMDETVEIFGCAPGFLQLGDGENTVRIPDPSWGGGQSPGAPGVPFEGDPPGPGGGSAEPPKPKLTPYQRHVQAAGRAWRRQCKGDPYEVGLCCNKKEDSCIIQYPKNHRKRTDYSTACKLEDYVAYDGNA